MSPSPPTSAVPVVCASALVRMKWALGALSRVVLALSSNWGAVSLEEPLLHAVVTGALSNPHRTSASSARRAVMPPPRCRGRPGSSRRTVACSGTTTGQEHRVVHLDVGAVGACGDPGTRLGGEDLPPARVEHPHDV